MYQNYLQTRYNYLRKPKSSYPLKLIQYLMIRFNIKKGMNILEIGSGRGEFLKEFKANGMFCKGIDIDRNAKTYLDDIDVTILDVTKDKFPFPDDYFDMIFHKSVIEHMYSPENMMCETLRILKPGGKVIILTPEWSSQMHVFYEDITHCRPYNMTSMRELFEMIGFQTETVEIFRQLPSVWYNHFALLIARLLTLLYGTRQGRWFHRITGIKFFRFAVELMVLGVAKKKEK